MRYLHLLIFLLIASHAILAQNGDVPLTHYKIPISPQDYSFNDLRIDKQGRLLVAYKKGILQFDGDSWLKIDISSSPIKFLDIGNRTFLLAKGGIYEMKEDMFHQNKLELLLQIPIISPVSDLIYFNEKYYLLTNEQIYIFDEEFNRLNVYESQLGYKDVFVFENKLYAFEDNYLLENIDGTWVDLNLFAPQDTDFLFSIKGKNNLYFAYDNGSFYSFDGKDFDPYSSELNEYLNQNYPLSGKFLNDKLIISTLSGGVVIVEETSGNINSTIQKYNGLSTNEVTALTMDNQNGLWLAHPYGLSRASLNIPLSDFQFYPGLNGLPEATIMRNDTFWVSSTEGLFYLKEVKDYETLQKKLVQKIKVSSPKKSTAEKDDDPNNFLENIFSFGENSAQEQYISEKLDNYREKYRNEGIRFRALRKKLDEKEQQLRDSIRNRNSKNTKSGSSPTYRSITKTIDISRLKSIDFEYQKVNEIKDHIESLVDTKFGLVAKSNTGIFLVNTEKVRKISNLKMIKRLHFQSELGILWITSEQGLFSINLQDSDNSLIKHSENIFNDLLINNNNLIAVGNNILEIFDIQNKKLTTVKKLNISNNFSEELALFTEGEKVKLLRSDAILELEPSSLDLKIDSLFADPLKYFLKDQEDNIWLLSAQDEWSTINKKLSFQVIKWLHTVSAIKNINMVNDSIIFFTTDDRIIRWKSDSNSNYPLPKTFINSVMVENQWVENDKFVELQYGQNDLKVILSTPEYLFKEEVEYQYFVKGLMDNWSSWSKNREIDFPYIPSGDYTLQIKAKTILNNEVNDFQLKFEVLPPYWQTWWFYALEIVFFSVLILVSIRLNTTNQSSYLTKTFTFLTLILFLELLATILENNLEGYVDESPVYTFIINVILALSITPIERGISKLLVILNSARSKKLISEMRNEQKKQEK
ncbi:Y_Y_Y domain-containing protein [Marivirga sericea]|uniref:Y_Y_Y domain-containing protein n=1 Tax=Marivirga sericea TaxID=1028 RepID=A0A1X7JLK4_9BACT|nr:triple tyrosine motif-containing protein [Marivirga sericea]SMG28790.1 Y_Y_Y domain-containing protein [Marivirga sericea]